MCKIIRGEEATEMMNATLDEMKVRKLLNGLRKTKAVVDHNNRVVSEALDRMINALCSELDAIGDLLRSKNDG